MATVIRVELLIPSLGLPVPSCQVVINKASAQSCCENQLCNPKEGQDPLAIRWAETSMCRSGYELKGTYRGHQWEIGVTPVQSNLAITGDANPKRIL